uniref:Uncharacterized protein n=1 Tax=Ditylum brightwellii TaxID=49249 RepID=A0A7S4URM3_9STRA
MPYQDDAWQKRESLLYTEMRKYGLEACYETRIYRPFYGTQDLEGEYLRRGYPSLEEVVKSYVPAVRMHLLQRAGCWVEDDQRCADFVAGSSEWPTKESVIQSIKEERAQRNERICVELSKHGIDSTKVLALPGWAKSPSLHRAADDFISSGKGEIDQIINAFVILLRYEDLKEAFKTSSLILPIVNIDILLYNKCGAHDLKETLLEINKKWDPRIVEFLLGETPVTSAKQLADMFSDERSSRKCAIDRRYASLDLELSSITPRYKYSHYLSKVEVFVEKNEGDGCQAVSQLALDLLLHSNQMATSKTFCREAPGMKERIDGCLKHGKERIHGLVLELAAEQEERLQAFCKEVTLALDSDTCKDLRLIHESVNILDAQKNDYVRFGSGTASMAMHKYMKSLREEAIKDLFSRDMLSKIKHNPRYNDFICGSMQLKTAKDLVAVFVEGKENHKKDIEAMFLKKGVASKDVDALPKYKTSKCEDFIQLGLGNSIDIVNALVKDTCESQLRALLEKASIKFVGVSKEPRIQAFAEGKSDVKKSFRAGLIVVRADHTTQRRS